TDRDRSRHESHRARHDAPTIHRPECGSRRAPTYYRCDRWTDLWREGTGRGNGERKVAVFLDFGNIVRGGKEAQYKNFEGKLVLERLLEKGKIIVRRAYADWNRFTEYKRPFHEWAIELIDVPQSRYSGKNSADIRMVVDALDLAYGKTHIDTFALVSG